MTDSADRCAHAPFASPEQFGCEHLGDGDKGSEVSLLTCHTCGGLWLKGLVEWEHHSRSGRWWLVPAAAMQREAITAQDAVAIVEGSAWGYEGGSFYDGVVQRKERAP
jgi:hypothetical protein